VDEADIRLHMAYTTIIGGVADGVLGVEIYSAAGADITIVSGWNWYTGADAGAVGSDQFDFQTVATHELGHALGLGHNISLDSVMHATLTTGVARRGITAEEIEVDSGGGDPEALHADVSLVPSVRTGARVADLADQTQLAAARTAFGDSGAIVLSGTAAPGPGHDANRLPLLAYLSEWVTPADAAREAGPIVASTTQSNEFGLASIPPAAASPPAPASQRLQHSDGETGVVATPERFNGQANFAPVPTIVPARVAAATLEPDGAVEILAAVAVAAAPYTLTSSRANEKQPSVSTRRRTWSLLSWLFGL